MRPVHVPIFPATKLAEPINPRARCTNRLWLLRQTNDPSQFATGLYKCVARDGVGGVKQRVLARGDKPGELLVVRGRVRVDFLFLGDWLQVLS
jgi:hypothetical protein